MCLGGDMPKPRPTILDTADRRATAASENLQSQMLHAQGYGASVFGGAGLGAPSLARKVLVGDG